MSAVLDILNPANTISVNRVLANAIGLNEAVVYTSLAAKSEYYESRDMTDNGWFFSTVKDLKESTSLSEKQQRTAIKKLVREGLICCKLKGVPAKRYFLVVDNTVRLSKIINDGAEKIREIKPSATEQMDEYKSRVDSVTNAECAKASEMLSKEVFNSFNSTSDNSAKRSELIPAKKQNKFSRQVSVTYKTKENKSKAEYNQSIAQSADMIDTMDSNAENKSSYLDVIKENIGYAYLCETNKYNKDYVDEIALLMADVVSTNRKTVRVCGENKPTEVVKSVFLKLDESHIQYVIDSMMKNATKVRNVRNYLITALYNAKFTLNSYYRSLVNHDMYSKLCDGGVQ